MPKQQTARPVLRPSKSAKTKDLSSRNDKSGFVSFGLRCIGLTILLPQDARWERKFMSMHFPKQFGTAQPLADPELQFRGPHGERGARAYNGDLGAEPPAESRGRAPGQGVRGAESI